MFLFKDTMNLNELKVSFKETFFDYKLSISCVYRYLRYHSFNDYINHAPKILLYL